MEMRPETGKELGEEVEEARRVAGLTVALAADLVERAHELGDAIEDRVRRLVEAPPGEALELRMEN